MMKANSGLWAVTCYFNPAGFRRRLENFKTFRARLNVPLVAVELACGSKFELEQSDADILIQLRCPDVMWQKERLLNIGFAAVPAGVEKVAWLDADIVFAEEEWAACASRQLDTYPMVHLLRRRVNLKPDATNGAVGGEAVSSVYQWEQGYPIDDSIADSSAPLRLKQTLGLAWAARRSILDEHGLYDAAIMGSADRVIIAAAVGRFGAGEQSIGMNEPQRSHFRQWAEPFYRSVEGSVGYADQAVYHLWHGALENRQYMERHEGLRSFAFDPAVDLRFDESGCWRWNSDKPEMHRYVRDYFSQRLEDG